MRIVIDCFKQVKGVGKSIGIYNLSLNLVKNLVMERERTEDKSIKESSIVVLGNAHNEVDFNIPGVEFIKVTDMNPLNKIHCLLWELFYVSSVCKKYNADRVVFPRGFCALTHPVKDIVIIHDLIPFYYDKHYPNFFNKLENWYIMKRLKSSAKTCNQVITISEASKNEILLHCGVGEEKITVIHNGCNEMSYDKVQQKNEKYIVAITSGLPHKNAKGVVYSYSEYCKQCDKPMPLVIIGIDSVDEYDIDEDIKGKITCHKFIKDNTSLHNMISNASIFMFLSLVEGFGFPPLEAMQLGVPVICSNCSSLPEIVGDAAVLVDPNDYSAVAKAMVSLEHDEEKCETLIELGYKNVERFAWDSRAKIYWETILRRL